MWRCKMSRLEMRRRRWVDLTWVDLRWEDLRCEGVRFSRSLFLKNPTLRRSREQCFVQLLALKSRPWLWKRSFCARFRQFARVEDVKTKLSCDASFKFQELKIWETKLSCDASFQFQELKIWKRNFRARLLSNSESWRCENKAFLRGFLQFPKIEDVKTKLSCDASFKFQECCKM